MKKMTWDEVLDLCKQLTKKLHGKTIWGVPRGGSIVAGIMAFHGCELTTSMAEVIVDDIADTGLTLADFNYGETAALLVCKGCNPMPAYWVKLVDKTLDVKSYYLFPWEDEKEVEKQLAKGNFRSTKSEQ